jgi:hypothetical protein
VCIKFTVTCTNFCLKMLFQSGWVLFFFFYIASQLVYFCFLSHISPLVKTTKWIFLQQFKAKTEPNIDQIFYALGPTSTYLVCNPLRKTFKVHASKSCYMWCSITYILINETMVLVPGWPDCANSSLFFGCLLWAVLWKLENFWVAFPTVNSMC